MDFLSFENTLKPQSGDLLLAVPYLGDEHFERSVVLLVDHSEEETIGFTLNKPSVLSLEDVVSFHASSISLPLFIGGPVQQDTLHIIHAKEDARSAKIEVNKQIYWCADYEGLLREIEVEQGMQEQVRFFLGYSGWGKGQLEAELEGNSWIICRNVTKEMIFNVAPENLWAHILTEMGGKYKMFANYPLDPRMN